MMINVRSLPIPPQPKPDDDPGRHGLRMFYWVLRNDVTATLSDRDLELADHAGPFASAIPGSTPAVYDRISRTRTLIMSALKIRRDLALETTPEPPQPQPADRPNAGPMARRELAPIVRPPAGDYADRIAF